MKKLAFLILLASLTGVSPLAAQDSSGDGSETPADLPMDVPVMVEEALAAEGTEAAEEAPAEEAAES